MIKASLLPRVAATVAAVALLPAAPALALAARGGESTPVDLTGASDAGAKHIGGGGSIVRTIVGLAIVIGVIYGVAWVLRQVKASRQPRATGSGLAALASVPLANGRSVHLVRAGRDLVLLGVAEQGVVPIRTYSEEEAFDAGLVDEHGMLILPHDETAKQERSRPRLALPSAARLPLPRLALPAPRQAAATLGAGGANAPSATATASARPRPQGGGALNTLRAWTVRG
jgi:flagellar protein FliO/FliZ